ncbi:palmitoyl protein thioesterase domain-containing protein [Hirsutella rhossiliensis]|uniref:Palmitoyl-protein thioesterase 1 n=1 Tax=Hirsutella rhossiliensis TaxID=111463 RepID=A0A9P8MTX7_9HYPO|nr:palmitoyl protein thioesterase domain-containing protein [Hirsutella rhossiliensis]KAH0961104.1 palmitoyl protein thioesterase domain-containing protein [Hirsutella rhossiliensis]
MTRRPPAPASLRLGLLLATSLLTRSSLAVVPPHPATLRVHDQPPAAASDDTPLPLVIWHGLGDSFAGDGVREVAALADAVHPGTYVHTVALGKDPAADRYATWYGNLTDQVQAVCDALAAHPILSTAPAVDALGFSQGGQFLRAYVERCNAPPVRSLVTFGSQHNGIVEFRACGPADWLCRGAMLLLRYSTWSSFVQGRLVPAQYFRDPADLQPYLDNSNFLADINNERGPARRNDTYRRNLARLANFVLYMFDADTTVVPRQTSWFAEVNGSDVVPLRERQLYRDDWLGLRQLDDKGRLFFRSLPGDHMDIPLQVLNDTMVEFFGPSKRSFAKSGAEFEPDEL